jgi:import inner membrane translocase subunit TIM23
MFSSFFNKKQDKQDHSYPPVSSPLLQDLAAPKPKKVTEEIEYLFIEDNPFVKAPRPTGSFGPLPMRTNSDKLLYGTGLHLLSLLSPGALYMMGLTSGGAYGFYRGLSVASGRSFKLRFNSCLNQITRYGPFAANSLGVLAMSWAMVDIALENIRGVGDYWNHVGAALGVGALFKSTAGARPMVVSSAIMGGIVAGYGLVSGELMNESRDASIAAAGISSTLQAS